METTTKVPYIPEDAPFSLEQKNWLGGFLAGLHSRLAMGGAAPLVKGTKPVAAKPIDILYGTQTGTAEIIANDAAEKARSKGFTPRLAELDDVDMGTLASMQNMLVVVSTYGEGEMPDNSHQFWQALSASTAPRLDSLNYGVLALGDTGYEFFCQAGRLIDTRLEQLGAKRMTDRVDCDIDYEELAEKWFADVLPDIGDVAEATPFAEAPKTKSDWGRKNPYMSTILDNRLLSGSESGKEIRHITFDLRGSGMTYEAGDALGVMPVNSQELVQAWLDRLGAKAEDTLESQDRPLGDLLRNNFEIMTPSRDMVRALEPLVKNDELTYVVNKGDKEALNNFLWGKDALDLMNLSPSLKLSASDVIGWLKPLQHRAYSISSSPKAHDCEVHLTVAAVRWMRENRSYGGVCSTFLADCVTEGATAGIFVSPNNNFRVPDDDSVPMIMVGPGTGIAPFRAFLQERRERGANGTNWLFFGDQHRASDFIYEDEIGALSESGVLTRLDLAFSRDQAEKIYVQHRITENGKDLFGLLQEGGHFYICGDAKRMAQDVDKALHAIIETQGGMTPEAATHYVNRLKREKRYMRDVY